MKIGIITILKVNNYGAELQAYALQRVLNNLGFDTEIIDYLFYKHPDHKNTRQSKPLFRFGLKKRLAETIYPLVVKGKTLFCSKAKKKRDQRFEVFHKENTRLSRSYRCVEDLLSTRMDYDIYMVGSDQVWNPGIYSSLAPYFLKFAPADKKCLAYASSFGVSTIPTYAKAYYSEALKRFEAIGVREDAGVRLVKDLSGKVACWVLDPTLLLSKEEWLKVAAPPCEIPQLERGYILLYELTPCPYILQLARHVNEMLYVPVVRICKNASREDKDKSILNIVDAGPSEFVGLFAHAKFVITNSFHGTAFAINLERDFYTVTPLRKQNNSRQQSLLKLFSLENRLIVEGDKFPTNNKLHIDYTDVRKVLERERKNSIQFLMDNCK